MDDETRNPGATGQGSEDGGSTSDRFPWRDATLSDDEQSGDDPAAVSRMLIESFEPVPPDPEVWDRVAAEITVDDRSKPMPNRADSATMAAPSARRTASRWYSITAIAAALVLVAGGIWVASTSRSNPTDTAGSITRELTDPETGIVALSLTIHEDGSTSTGASDLVVLDADHTDQSW